MDVEIDADGLSGADGTGQVSSAGAVHQVAEGSVVGPQVAGTAAQDPSRETPSVLSELLSELESADDLPLDERLELLRRAESSIAGSLEGLDGL